MFARLLTSLSLLTVGAMAASSGRAFEGSDRIAVYLHHHSDVPSDVVEAMWHETESLMGDAGYRLTRVESRQQVNASFFVVADFEGPCALDASSPAMTTRTLASTVTEDGRIFPFVKLSCAALRSFLGSELGSGPDSAFLYGRALGRLLAHELYHIAAQTSDHAWSGLTQAQISVDDLISGEFVFCNAAVRRLRH